VKVLRVASPRYILDTGPLVAFANAADEHHRWAREVLNALGEAPVTCEIVLAEACYLLANSQRAVDLVLALPGQGRVIVEPVLAGKDEQVRTAVAKYWPTMDVADGCVLQLAERFPKAKVITTDVRDFRIYRRNRNDPIPLIHP
jgi:predicted nucleic acid-binding protein